MQLALVTAVSMFGLLIGSFLNVVAIRLLKGESIAYPPSHCVHCHHPLKPLDLIPVLSYIGLRGRCRYCKETISPAYPLGELAAGILYGLMAWRFGWTEELAAALFFVSVGLVAAMTDIRAMLIPNKIVAVGVAGMLLLRLWTHPLPLWDYAIAFFAGSGILYIIALASRGGMGGGDVKLYAFVGLMLGLKLTLLSILFASLLGTLYGVMLLIRGRYRRRMAIPFGPFIVLGAVAALLWGDCLLELYRSSFLAI